MNKIFEGVVASYRGIPNPVYHALLDLNARLEKLEPFEQSKQKTYEAPWESDWGKRQLQQHIELKQQIRNKEEELFVLKYEYRKEKESLLSQLALFNELLDKITIK